MKKQADKSKINTSKTPDSGGRSSKNGEIETYLSQHYVFRYNTVWGRAEYRGREDTRFLKVGRYEINTLRRELDNEAGLTTSPDNLYLIIESSFSPRVNPIQAVVACSQLCGDFYLHECYWETIDYGDCSL